MADRIRNAVLTFFLVLESGPGFGDFGTCRRIGGHALHGSISHRHTPAIFVLYDEISGVRRNDPVFPGQLGRFIAKLGGFTVDADFIEEKSDTARRPKPGHVIVSNAYFAEGIGRLAIIEMQFVSKRLFAAADVAGQLRFDVAGAAVSTRYDQLVSFK